MAIGMATCGIIQNCLNFTGLMSHSWIWSCMIVLYLFQPSALWFCSQHIGCYDNAMQFPVHKVLLTAVWGIINMGWCLNPGEMNLSPHWQHIGEIDTLCQSVFSFLLFLLTLSLSLTLSVSTCFFPLSLSLSLSQHWHFHLLPWGLEMSLREVLVRLSGSSRALWLWQTSFNWEEARRVWKNWNIHETPFIRHNLNSAWKKPYMYKEKSTSLLLCVLPSSPPRHRQAPARFHLFIFLKVSK